MSINIALLEAVGKGLIVQLTPYVQTDKPIRKIYLASEINDAFFTENFHMTQTTLSKTKK